MRLWLVSLGLLPILLVGSGPGAGASTPALPPQNGLIAMAGVDGLQIVDPATGVVSSIPDTTDLGEPAWSPDGTLLAATLWTEDGPAVYTMKPDGTERQLLLANASSPSWAPDGKRIVVVRDIGEAKSSLVTVDTDGNDVHELALISAYADSAAWSPDGKQIAFFAEDEIRLISTDGAEDTAKTIAKAPGVLVRSLSWSPDSSKLAFDRVQKGTESTHVIVVLDLATGAETILRGEQEGAWAPVWSPDGKQFAFLSQSPSTAGVSGGCGAHFRSQLWAMNTDGANARQLTKGGEFYSAVSWARAVDGAAPAPAADEQPAPPVKQESAPPADRPPAAREETAESSATSKPAPAPVAETTEPPSVTKGLIAVRGSNGIYLVHPDTADAHKVPGTGSMIAPAWSPDDSLLAVEQVEKAGPSSIYTLRPDGTRPQLVLKNASAPAWSPAGDRIYVLRNECSTPCEPEDDEPNVLYSVRPDGSDLQRVGEETDVYYARELAWRTDGSPIWFFEDGSENAPGTFDTSAAAWSPDETRIAFIGALGPTDEEVSAGTITAGLWIVSAEGGTPRLLLKGASGWPSWPSASR